jgi:peptidoglycan hydrolase-like protein with peptidoglycan-binding domain
MAKRKTTAVANRNGKSSKTRNPTTPSAKKPTKSFELPENLEAVANGTDVGRLQEYLKKFGYLEADKPATNDFAKIRDAGLPEATANQFDESTSAAIRAFQKFNGLNATGVADADTIHLMSMPRCGNPDCPNRYFAARARAGLAEFVAQGSKWSRANVTFGFENFTGDLTQQVIVIAIRQAFLAWSRVCSLTFTEVGRGADISIAFRTGDHGDGSPFDGVGIVLAHGFYPPPYGGASAGDLHFDDDETWTTDSPPTGRDFLTVALHEIGHTLGLDHSADVSAVMYAFYGGIRRDLRIDDIAGIRSIYGNASDKSTLSDTSITSPAFETFANRGYISWSGTDSQHRLNVMATDEMRVWHTKITLNETSLSGPALATFNNRLYMAWRGVGNNQLNIMSSSDGVNWAGKVTLGDTTFHRPALAVFNNRLVLGWTGTDSSRRLNIIQSANGTTWNGKQTLADTSINGPGLSQLGGNLVIAWTGTDSGRHLNAMSFDGSVWKSKVTLSDTSPAGPSLATVGSQLILGWSGTDSARQLNTLRSVNGVNFFAKATYGDTSEFGPSIGSLGEAPIITWTGRDTAQSLNAMRI